MSVEVPAVILEGVARALKVDRGRLQASLTEFLGHLEDIKGDIARRLGSVMAASDSADEQFSGVAALGADVTDYNWRVRLYLGLGLGTIGGIVLAGASGGVLATLVGICLVVAAGLVSLSLIGVALSKLEQALRDF